MKQILTSALRLAVVCGALALAACGGNTSGRAKTQDQAQTRSTAVLEIDELLAADACFSLKDLAVKGNDLLTLGLRGRAVGAALQACLDAVIDEVVPNDRAALLAYAAENLQRFANS